MLTRTQKAYLEKIPDEKAGQIVSIKPYDKKIGILANNIIRRIKKVVPGTEVKFMGASSFGIAGLNDIDIYVFCSPEKKREYILKLKILFTVEINNKDKWKWVEKDVDISVKITNPKEEKRIENIKFHNILKADYDLLKKYEDLKKSMDGKSYKKYYEVKMDFFTRVYHMHSSENVKNTKFLEKIGAAITNSHIITPSGRHSKRSFTKYKLYPHTKETFHVAKIIAKQFINEKVEAVVGVATGGDILSELVAYYLEKITKKKVFSFYIKKDYNNNFILRDHSNKELIKNKKVLIVDDTLDTSKTVKNIKSFIQNLQGKVVGIGVICTRNGFFADDLEVPKFYTFINNEDILNSYLPEDCPMCKKGIPINKDFGINT